MNDLTNLVRDIIASKARKPERGALSCDTSINELGIDWDVRVTYNGTPGGRGYTPRGERQIDPDYGPEIEIVSVELIAADTGKAMQQIVPPIEVYLDELSIDSAEQIEQKCIDDYNETQRDREEVGAELSYELARDRAEGI